MNDALRRAMAEARLTDTDVAAALGVDPKTVQRWLAGRRPHPRHRWAVADLLRTDERKLWPELWPEVGGLDGPTHREIKASYPYRSAVPHQTWQHLFAGAQHQIGILATAALFLAEDIELVRLLADKARSGVTVRLLLADPNSPQLANRGAEQRIGGALAARVHNTIALFQPLLETEGVQARQHDTVLYNAIFRADDEMLINPQVHGIAAAYAPVLHLRYLEPGGMFTTYADSFERIWSDATPLKPADDDKTPIVRPAVKDLAEAAELRSRVDGENEPLAPPAGVAAAVSPAMSGAESGGESGEQGAVFGRRAVLCGAAATLGVHEPEALRRELTAAVEQVALAEASLDDWERTVHQYGLGSGYRSAASLLSDLTADFAELRRVLDRRRAILVPNRLTRVMAQMAGLMTIPLNKLDQAVAARNWARTAKLLAGRAGDDKLHAWVLGQEAYAHYYSGNLVEAVYVALHAQRMARQAPCAGVAHAAALEARAHALAGRGEETYAAIGRAEQALSGMHAQELAPSAFDYDQARFHFHAGNAYTHLGKTAAAFDAQERALELYPPNSYFDRALVTLDRADCFVHDDDIPAATEWAIRALQSVGAEQRNPLIDNRADQVLNHIPRRATGLPAVRELRELLRDSSMR